MALSTDLSQLKKLQKDLRERDAAEEQITRVKEIISDLQDSCYTDARNVSKLSTNNAKKYDEELKKSNRRKEDVLIKGVSAVVVIVLIALIACTILTFNKSTYLYTPEIVNQYKGILYCETYDETTEGFQEYTLDIKSCSKSGELEGTYECTLGDTVLASYNFTGKIKGKSTDGYTKASLSISKWIIEPETQNSTYGEIKEIIISDNYTTFEVLFDNSDYLCELAPLGNQVTDLETPEIIRSYGGTYTTTPNTYSTIKDHIGIITISSCDANGNVKGFLEYDSHSTFGHTDTLGKYAINGQITEKYDSGAVCITLNAGNWIKQPSESSKPMLEEFPIIIFDDYSKLSCQPYYANWTLDTTMDDIMPILENESAEKYFKVLMENQMAEEEAISDLKAMLEDEGVSEESFTELQETLENDLRESKEPKLLKRSEETSKQIKTLLLLCLLTPVAGFILGFVLIMIVPTNSKAKKEKLNKMIAQDKAAELENHRRYERRLAEKKKEADENIKMWSDEISTQRKISSELEKEIAANNVLAAKDKNLDAVDYIIDLIESRRADSVKEALREYDRFKAERSAREAEYVKQHMAAFDTKYKAQQDYENYINQKIHNAKLEREAERQSDELKRIRKELEDRR